jgi:hypothetical protein
MFFASIMAVGLIIAILVYFEDRNNGNILENVHVCLENKKNSNRKCEIEKEEKISLLNKDKNNV